MRTWQRRALTHAACLGIGLVAAVSLKQAASTGQPEVRADGGGAGGGASEKIPARTGRPAGAKVLSKEPAAAKTSGKNDFRGAWDAIASRNLTVSQRLEMQIAVLREWSMVDMEGAMQAALDNAWDGGTQKGGVGPLMVAFDEAFQARPMDAWDLLQSGKMGLGTELFRKQWITLRMGAIQMAMRASVGNPEMEDRMRRKLADLPDEPDYDNYIAIAFNALPPSEENAAELVGRLAVATNERAKTMLLHELSATLREAGAATLSAEWAKLTPEMQKRAAVAFLNGPQGTKNAPAVLDMLMATDQWDRVTAAGNQLLEYSRNVRDTKQLAEWGMKLPERPEADHLFRRTIDPLINRDNAGAREWIDSLPPGNPRKDRILFAYTQNAIFARNDEGLFQWAVERMSDPEKKAAAQRSYDGWAKRRGLGGN
ncbi:MAG: hypothetical protein EOP87_16285 [Verrucomicrobiaceae bacterium]|nr:MAG: hypothetical protein EOP87_16285 [Verrucomicrobiaceae bacterium]